jgi:A/G-specific adenine glycosylase
VKRPRAGRATGARPRLTSRLTIPATARLEFGRRLRAWYRRNARDLPWRRTRDPYEVLVSELMLQQTQVIRVVPRYGEFLRRFPTLASVAASEPAHVMEAWEGLGYYARARALHQLARLTSPALPDDPAALRALPGIGAYTAGAVASFAFERRAALVDTNVARVLTRVFAPRLDPRTPHGRRTAWAIAEATLPRSGTVAYAQNQALIELGALICTARVAHCSTCPVSGVCKSAAAAKARRPRATNPDRPARYGPARYRPAGAVSVR